MLHCSTKPLVRRVAGAHGEDGNLHFLLLLDGFFRRVSALLLLLLLGLSHLRTAMLHGLGVAVTVLWAVPAFPEMADA